MGPQGKVAFGISISCLQVSNIEVAEFTYLVSRQRKGTPWKKSFHVSLVQKYELPSEGYMNDSLLLTSTSLVLFAERVETSDPAMKEKN